MSAMHASEVALVTPYPPRGTVHGGSTGVASYSANLAAALAQRGARVQVFAPGEPDADDLTSDGLAVRRFGPGVRGLLWASRAASALRAGVVHLQHELFLYGRTTVPGFLAALSILRRARTPVVVTMHQVVDPSSVDRTFTDLHGGGLPPALVRAGISAVQTAVPKLGDAVLVHEEGSASVVPGARVVPHGIEPSRPVQRTAARRALGLGDRFTALCFGFIAPYKGLEFALDAASSIDDVRLVIAGGPHPRFRAYERDLRRRWSSRARFTGPVPDAEVPLWFAAADVVLLAYPRPHASSGVLALALAHGAPVLMSEELGRYTGAPEEMRVPLDPAALAARLRTLAAAPDDGERLAASASTLAHGRSWDEVALRHLDLYEEVSDADRAVVGSLRS